MTSWRSAWIWHQQRYKNGVFLSPFSSAFEVDLCAKRALQRTFGRCESVDGLLRTLAIELGRAS